MNSPSEDGRATLFDVAYTALKDAYAVAYKGTQCERVLETALNRLHSMPTERAEAGRVKELEAEVSTLREHLAEVNRLMSLNCRELERLRGTPEPKGHVAISGICMPGCPACKVKP